MCLFNFVSRGVCVKLRDIAFDSLNRKMSHRTQWWCLKCVLVYLVPDTKATRYGQNSYISCGVNTPEIQ